jgi:2-keto-4-pentenoate hydratase/2-oxohepta-3-ene-1,7-dioic acid hydratase in catechol pathway
MELTTLPGPTKIVCVGRNYVQHAAELGNAVPEEPLLFLKPPSSLIADGDAIILPPEAGRVEHEGEIAVVMGRRCHQVEEAEAIDCVAGFAALNDVTARDLQRRDAQWTRAKGFDTFCPMGPVVSADSLDWREMEVLCSVDGQLRQQGEVRAMVFPIPDLIAYISGIMTLYPGDVIATGTPEGVGPLAGGSTVVVEVRVGGAPVSRVRTPVSSA